MLSGSRTELAKRSVQVRRAIKQQRHSLATGELTIADVMLAPAAALGDRTLSEILLMARGIDRTRLAELNTRAIDDAVGKPARPVGEQPKIVAPKSPHPTTGRSARSRRVRRRPAF